MEIPFADGVLSRLGRRGAALDLIEDIEVDSIDSLDAADLPAADPALLLQKMENRLVRHHLVVPDVLSSEEVRRLRYILNFARLADFEPGAAGPGSRRGRGDVSVGAEIANWRSRVADALYGPLREERDPTTALTAARDVLAGLVDDQDEQRQLSSRTTGTTSPPPNWTPRSATRSSSRCSAAAEVRVSSTSAACSGCWRPATCPTT